MNKIPTPDSGANGKPANNAGGKAADSVTPGSPPGEQQPGAPDPAVSGEAAVEEAMRHVEEQAGLVAQMKKPLVLAEAIFRANREIFQPTVFTDSGMQMPLPIGCDIMAFLEDIQVRLDAGFVCAFFLAPQEQLCVVYFSRDIKYQATCDFERQDKDILLKEWCVEEIESPHLDQPIAGTDHNCGKSVGRNSKCPCGSGKKFKRCCLQRESVRSTAPLSRDAFKDAVNCIWWLSPSPWPKSSNRRVAVPYSESMKHLLKNGYRANVVRPSGHEISEKFSRDHGSAIPPNLIAVPNTESNSYYLRYCKAIGLPPHPARFPSAIPEYFIRMLTDIGDTVVDPFAGSCVTGEVAERLKRKWICCDLVEEYLHGALARFDEPDSEALVPRAVSPARSSGSGKSFYRVHHPGSLWEANTPDSLQEDGGQTRPQSIGNTTSQDDLHV